MLLNYLKIAFKVLLRRKFFSAVSLFGISFTLMVLMVATAVLDNGFGPHAPESERRRTLALYEIAMIGERNSSSGSAGYRFLSDHVRPLGELPAVEEVTFFQSSPRSAASYVAGRKIETLLKRVDGAFWRVFDFDFVEGGPFGDEDERDRNFVAVINETTRRRYFGDAPAVGETVTLDWQTFRVVGVVSDVAYMRRLPFAEMWVPISTSTSSTYRHDFRGGFRAAVMTRARSDFADVKAEFQSRVQTIESPDPERYDRVYAFLDTPLEDAARGLLGDSELERRPRAFLAILIGAMVLFMVLPSVNLVNLNLSRMLERASEIGVRRAFGASSRVLIGQFVVENVVLTLIGGTLGLMLSLLVLRVVNGMDLIPYAQFTLNTRVFGYGLLLALFFGLFSGVYPAWRMSRLHPVAALRGRA